MKKLCFLSFVVVFLLAGNFKNSFAFFDPLLRPNNFHGIHILFPSELSEAKNLVNSKDGEWGYVTIPIQAGDKDIEKWQKFMDDCKEYKLIPIIRLATQADPQNTTVWSKPTYFDIIDFANFLNSLAWPVENRYVIVFNEVNRSDEWSGEPPSPTEYADLLSYTVEVFKDRNPNFYMIMAGLDNAAPNDRVKYMDNFVYLNEMKKYNPEIFNKIDGFASHSYPNPGFIAPPLKNKREGITTYQYEYDLINADTSTKKPAFITETGWDSTKLPESTIASYYKIAYSNFWNPDHDKIVAITPFLLNSQGGAFDIFSFVKEGRQTKYYEESVNMEKTKGQPLLEAVKGIAVKNIQKFKKLVSVSQPDNKSAKNLVITFVKLFF